MTFIDNEFQVQNKLIDLYISYFYILILLLFTSKAGQFFRF